MLAATWYSARLTRLAVETRRRRNLYETLALEVNAARHIVGMACRLIRGKHRPEANVGVLEQSSPLLPRLRGEHLGEV